MNMYRSSLCRPLAFNPYLPKYARNHPTLTGRKRVFQNILLMPPNLTCICVSPQSDMPLVQKWKSAKLKCNLEQRGKSNKYQLANVQKSECWVSKIANRNQFVLSYFHHVPSSSPSLTAAHTYYLAGSSSRYHFHCLRYPRSHSASRACRAREPSAFVAP